MKIFKIFSILAMMLVASTANAEEENIENGDALAQSSKGSGIVLDQKSKQIIKTLQRKTFLKMKRWELSPHIAFVANDPFLNRYVLGVGVTYNLTEVFGVEAMLDFSPDLGDADWKPLTKQLVNENSVSPDISKIGAFGSFCFVFSPIYGKAAVVGKNIINFDIYGKFGMGGAQTTDDLKALSGGKSENNETALSTQVQFHPTTNFGAGAKIIFNPNVAARVEGRSLIYIETVDATTLEMKNNFLLQFSATFYFPTIKS